MTSWCWQVMPTLRGRTGGGLPTTPGAYDRSFGGVLDGFVLRRSR